VGRQVFITKMFSWPYSFSVVEKRSSFVSGQTVGFYTGNRKQFSFYSCYILK